MSRKKPNPPPGPKILKWRMGQKPPPPPPERPRRGEPVESTPNTVCCLVYLMLGKKGIRDMITAVHEYDGLTTEIGSDPPIKKGP